MCAFCHFLGVWLRRDHGLMYKMCGCLRFLMRCGRWDGVDGWDGHMSASISTVKQHQIPKLSNIISAAPTQRETTKRDPKRASVFASSSCNIQKAFFPCV